MNWKSMMFLFLKVKNGTLWITFTQPSHQSVINLLWSFDSQIKQNVTLIFFEFVAKIYWLLTQPPPKNIAAECRIQETKWQIGFPLVWKCRQLRMHLGIRINLAVKEETEMQQKASKAKAWNSETKLWWFKATFWTDASLLIATTPISP